PSLNEKIDLRKWPDPGVVTRHLSPIVMSENYAKDGYVTESVGPVTLYQAVVVSLASAAGVLSSQQKNQASGINSWKKTPISTPSSTVSPNPAFAPVPARTP